jgi:hypothetical protein
MLVGIINLLIKFILFYCLFSVLVMFSIAVFIGFVSLMVSYCAICVPYLSFLWGCGSFLTGELLLFLFIMFHDFQAV